MNLFSTAVIVGALFLTTNLLAQDGPNPDQVYIKRLTYAGPGCAAGTVASNTSPDAKAFTLIFSAFDAEIGPGTPGGRSKNHCTLTIDMRFPQGWSYTVFDVDYRGFVSLEAGVNATQTSKYYFQASSNLYRQFVANFNGPVEQDYSIRNTLALTDYVWSTCGRDRALNIEAEINLNNLAAPANQGLITVDTIDGQLTHRYGIVWRRCT